MICQAKGIGRRPSIKIMKVNHPFLLHLVKKAGRKPNKKHVVLFGGKFTSASSSPNNSTKVKKCVTAKKSKPSSAKKPKVDPVPQAPLGLGSLCDLEDYDSEDDPDYIPSDSDYDTDSSDE